MYQGKVVFITGGSRGIGYAAVEKALAQGAKVCFLSHYEETGKAAMEKLMAINPAYEVMTAYPCLWNYDEVKAVVDQVVEKWGGIDVLICNAGVDSNMPTTRISEEHWDYVMNVNLKGSFTCVKAVLPAFKAAVKAGKKPGSIVLTASVTGTQGSAMGLPYPVSKHGVVGMARSLAMELSFFGINVNCVCPGVVDTDMVAALTGIVRKQVEGTVPFKRFATPGEVADLLLYLGSDAGHYITGEAIEITGGYKSTVPNMG